MEVDKRGPRRLQKSFFASPVVHGELPLRRKLRFQEEKQGHMINSLLDSNTRTRPLSKIYWSPLGGA